MEIFSQIFTSHEILSAAGQGALGLEIRKDDDLTQELIDFLNHKETELAVRAERAFLKELGGGCQVPIAAHGQCNGDHLILEGMVAELDGNRLIKDEIRGRRNEPDELGVTLAKRILRSGADEILSRIYGAG